MPKKLIIPILIFIVVGFAIIKSFITKQTINTSKNKTEITHSSAAAKSNRNLQNFNYLITDINFYLDQIEATTNITKAKTFTSKLNETWNKLVKLYSQNPTKAFANNREWQDNLNKLTQEFQSYQKLLNQNRFPNTKLAKSTLLKYFKAEELDTCLNSGKPILAEFGHGRCLACKQMMPILKAISAQFGPKLIVISPDVYEKQKEAMKYQIMVIPTQIFFNEKGEEIDRHIGLIDKTALIKKLKELKMIK